MSNQDLLIDALNCLVGKSAWAAIAGTGTGWVVDFKFGEKIKRERPIPNPHLSEDERLFQGQFGLMVWSPWRIANEKSITCGSYDDEQENGPMLTGLKTILNTKIQTIELLKPFFDLRILFENSLSFTTFCDTSDVENDSYVFFSSDKTYSLKPNGIILIKPIQR